MLRVTIASQHFSACLMLGHEFRTRIGPWLRQSLLESDWLSCILSCWQGILCLCWFCFEPTSPSVWTRFIAVGFWKWELILQLVSKPVNIFAILMPLFLLYQFNLYDNPMWCAVWLVQDYNVVLLIYKHNRTNTIPTSQYAHKTLYTPSIFVVGLTVYKEYNENCYVPMSQSTLGHMIKKCR